MAANFNESMENFNLYMHKQAVFSIPASDRTSHGCPFYWTILVKSLSSMVIFSTCPSIHVPVFSAVFSFVLLIKNISLLCC